MTHNPNNDDCAKNACLGAKRGCTTNHHCTCLTQSIVKDYAETFTALKKHDEEPTEVYQCKNQHKDGKYPCKECEKISQKEPTEGWEEWIKELEEQDWYETFTQTWQEDQCKGFIQRILSQREARVRGEILRKIDELERTDHSQFSDDHLYDSALAEVRAIITQPK